jgi:phosphate-selective porin OprO/OprP
VADGSRSRVSPAVFYYYKALGAFGEYMRTNQRIARSGTTSHVINDGWEVTGSYVLTGEAASDRGVRPRRPFSPPDGQWGALQLVARYTEVRFDDEIPPLGFAGTDAARAATSFTLGVNWYPAAVFKYYLTYERTSFDSSTETARPDENVILFRLQLGI